MPEPRRRCWPVATATAVLAALLLSSCGGGGGDGPLSVGDQVGSGEWCLPRFEAGGDVSHGSERLRNDSDEPVTVTAVTLVDPVGFELVDSYQLPVGRIGVLGTLIGWPPRKADQLSDLTTIAPGSEINVVFHLRSTPDATRASIAAVRIGYEVDGRDHEAVTGFSVRWAQRCGP